MYEPCLTTNRTKKIKPLIFISWLMELVPHTWVKCGSINHKEIVDIMCDATCDKKTSCLASILVFHLVIVYKNYRLFA